MPLLNLATSLRTEVEQCVLFLIFNLTVAKKLIIDANSLESPNRFNRIGIDMAYLNEILETRKERTSTK